MLESDLAAVNWPLEFTNVPDLWPLEFRPQILPLGTVGKIYGQNLSGQSQFTAAKSDTNISKS